MIHVYLQLLDELKKNPSLVLGTLVKTKGSTPQVPGASAIFDSNGLVYGTLGGGILEAKTIELAKKSVSNGENIFEEFSLNADINADSGAICGGHATFLLDANPLASKTVFQQIKSSLAKRKSGVLITKIQPDKNTVYKISRFWIEKNKRPPNDSQEKFGLDRINFEEVLITRKPLIIKSNKLSEEIVFVEPIFSKSELLIVGAGHIGQALCKLGNLIDFEVTVLDGRADLATVERFPDATRIINENIEKGFDGINITENTYIVIVTQGHHDDGLALKCCIKSNAAYIGMIGSKRKTALMLEKLLKEGLASQAELDKIYAPIGIDIHSKTIQEIAVSISAQLINERYLIQNKKHKAEIACIVLAAGEAKRMKQQKMLLPFNGKTIVETVIEKAKQSKADDICVILGSDKKTIESKIAYLDVQITENRDFKNGMLSSVQSGINALNPNINAVIILLGDQPMITSKIIDELIDTFNSHSKGIIIPTYNGKRGHPILIDLKYSQEINNLNPEIGLRELMMNHSDELLEIPVDTISVLNDIDTPEDYKRETS